MGAFWVEGSLLCLVRTIAAGVVSALAVLAHNFGFGLLYFFRAFEELVALLATVFAPDSLDGVSVISYNSVFSCFFTLKQDGIDHSFSNFKIIFGFSSQVYM